MKKSAFILAGGVVLVAAGIGITVMRGSGDGVTVDSGKNVSYEDFMNGKIGNAHCVMLMDEQGGHIESDLYFSGIRMRMDHSVEHQGGKFTSHILNDGEYIHVWGNGPAITMKFDPEELDDGSYGLGPDQDLADILSNEHMTCFDWEVDESLLTKPSDVSFIDATNGIDFGDPFETVEGGDAITDDPLEITPEQAAELIKQFEQADQNQFGDHYPDLLQ